MFHAITDSSFSLMRTSNSTYGPFLIHKRLPSGRFATSIIDWQERVSRHFGAEYQTASLVRMISHSSMVIRVNGADSEGLTVLLTDRDLQLLDTGYSSVGVTSSGDYLVFTKGGIGGRLDTLVSYSMSNSTVRILGLVKPGSAILTVDSLQRHVLLRRGKEVEMFDCVQREYLWSQTEIAQEHPFSLKYGSDGRSVTVGSIDVDGNLAASTFDVKSATLLKKVILPRSVHDVGQGYIGLEISEDGRRVVFQYTDHQVHVIDLITGELRSYTHGAHALVVESIVKDNQSVIARVYDKNGIRLGVAVLDFFEFEDVSAYVELYLSADRMRVDSTGRFLYNVTEPHVPSQYHRIDVRTRAEFNIPFVGRIATQATYQNSLLEYYDEAGETVLALHNPTTLEESILGSVNELITPYAISANGRFVAVLTKEPRVVKVIDLTDYSTVFQRSIGTRNSVDQMQLSRDGGVLFVQADTGKLYRVFEDTSIEVPERYYPSRRSEFSLSADGESLLSISPFGNIVAYNWRSENERFYGAPDGRSARSAMFTPDGASVVGLFEDGIVRRMRSADGVVEDEFRVEGIPNYPPSYISYQPTVDTYVIGFNFYYDVVVVNRVATSVQLSPKMKTTTRPVAYSLRDRVELFESLVQSADVYSYEGQQVHADVMISEDVVDIATHRLSKGLYFVRLTGRDGRTLIRSFVKL